MHAPELAGVPSALWRLVAFAHHRLLMLDYDGTLAPFRVRRDEAVPLPGVLELLERVVANGRTRVAVVSGRELDELRRLVGDPSATLVGEHGWSVQHPGGARLDRPLDDATGAALRLAAERAEAAGWGEWLERKRTALVLHTRGLPASRALALRDEALALWRPLVRAAAVAVDAIDGGVEIRAHARHKGTVVRSLLDHAPPGSLAVFVGDDVTDEDAFEALRGRGFGVRIGDPREPSRALARLPSCEAVPAFLARWLEVTADRLTHPG